MGRLELRVIREFRDWVKARVDDPLSLPKEYFELLPKEEQLERVKRVEAINKDLRNFSIQSPLAKEFLATEEGAAKFAQLLLKEHQPDVTEEEAFLFLAEAGPQFAEALKNAQGQLPNGQAPAAA